MSKSFIDSNAGWLLKINEQMRPSFERFPNNNWINTTHVHSVSHVLKSTRPAIESLSGNNWIDTAHVNAVSNALKNIRPAFEGFPNSNWINTLQFKTWPNIDQITSIGQSLITFSDQITEIDWENFELTDEEIEQANEILKNENAAEKVSNELSENKEPNKISKSIKSVIFFIYHLTIFIAALTDVALYVQDRIVPVVQSRTGGAFQSEKVAVKWINAELIREFTSRNTIETLHN